MAYWKILWLRNDSPTMFIVANRLVRDGNIAIHGTLSIILYFFLPDPHDVCLQYRLLSGVISRHDINSSLSLSLYFVGMGST